MVEILQDIVFSFPNNLPQESFLYILSYNNTINTPNSGVSPKKTANHQFDHNYPVFAPVIMLSPYLSDTVGRRRRRCLICLLFLGGHLTHSFFIICTHYGVCLIVILDQRRVFFFLK